MWNEAVNDWVLRHLAWSDFEIEAKLKNLASEGLAQYVRKRLSAPTGPSADRLSCP
jgi:hypothetical protein